MNFTAKGENKASFSIQHKRLPQQEDVDAFKALWKEKIALITEIAKTLD